MNRILLLSILIIGISASCGQQEPQSVATAEGAPPLRPWKLICLGGSSTIGEDIFPTQAYPARLAGALQNAVGQPVKVVNAGIFGETIEGAGLRLSWILQQRLDAFLLALGEEEIDQALSPEEARQMWEGIFQTLRSAYPQIPVFVLPLEPVDQLPAWWAELQASYEVMILQPDWQTMIGNREPAAGPWTEEHQAAVAEWLTEQLKDWPVQYYQ
ncbi:MAG: GDSL-type esterase/lipase family protein [Bacteroidota bacterium]